MFINFRHLIYINHIVAHSWIYIPMLSPFISFIKNVPITSCNCIICITHAIKNHIYIRANIIKHTYIYYIYIISIYIYIISCFNHPMSHDIHTHRPKQPASPGDSVHSAGCALRGAHRAPQRRPRPRPGPALHGAVGLPCVVQGAGPAGPEGPEGPEGLGTWGLIPQWMAMDSQDEPLFNVDVGGFWWF
jgi:hypothetical protein